MAELSGQEDPRLASSAILLGSREAALELGIDLNATLREYRINPRLLTSPEGYLTHYQVINFLQTVAERFDCEHFGFLVGKHQVPMQLGLVAQVLKLSPNLHASLENGIHYSELYTQITRHAVVIEDGYACFRRWDAQPYHGGVVQLHALGVVQLFKLIQALCGSGWQATSISFAHSAPKEKQQISRYFGCPVHFEGEFDGVIFPESDLSRPIATADADLLKIVQAHLDTLQSSQAQDEEIVSRIGGFIRREIGSNLCNLDSCAQLFNVHPRSLQRELAKHGCTFKQLLLDMRMELAEQYLRGSNISLSDLTGMLGYNNLSAFSRAFKNRNGQSPELWKKELLSN
jgi:AraC-like DNA-binding protein